MSGHETILNYGLGLVSDFSEIGFDGRHFVKDAVLVHAEQGTVTRAPAHPLVTEEWKKNIFYQKNVLAPTDIYDIHIQKEDARKGAIGLHIKNTKQNALLILRIRVDPLAEISLFEQIDNSGYLGMIVEITVGRGAQVHYTALQTISQEGYGMILRHGVVEEDGVLGWMNAELGGTMSKATSSIDLVGSGARGEIHGLFFGTEKQRFDIYTVIRHKASHTTSTIDVRGVLHDQSETIYRGLIQIHKGARGCDGAQREETIVLSKEARIGAIPELEIENNDVRCSHAVSTAHIDPERLFYLQSRGLSSHAATRCIIEAHLGSIVSRITDERVQMAVREMMEEKLDRRLGGTEMNMFYE